MAADRAAVRAESSPERGPAPTPARVAAVRASSAARSAVEHAGYQAARDEPRVATSFPFGSLQRATLVASHDAAEVEARDTAARVMHGPAVARVSAAPGRVQRAPAPTSPATASSNPSTGGGGEPLSGGVRAFMEERFGAELGSVRIHADVSAAQASAGISARAFTVGPHIYFGRDQFQPETATGRELIAHELTHVVQQGAVMQKSGHEAPPVSRRAPQSMQRWGVGEAVDAIAEKANWIPGFRLLTIVLGMNPINFAAVKADGPTILRALLELIPITGPLVVQALDSYGIIDKVGTWFAAKVHGLGLAAGSIKAALDAFMKSLSWSDVFDLGGVWDRAKRIFTEPIDRLIAFGKATVVEILGFIRQAILLPLARLAEGTRGYDLLKAVLGEDPVTGEKVQPTPEALIGGFMKLIGQEEVWQNMVKAKAVPRAWAWFRGAVAGLLGFVRQIPTLFVNALKSLELSDLLFIPKAFAKLANVFGGFVMQFISWAGNAMWTLLELIFEVVSPATLAYLRKTGSALKSILKDPLPFVRNLVRAAKLGLSNFADNFVTHLKAGLIEWLVGALPGVYIPKAFTLGEIVKFIFSVLGLSWANIRPKLVKVVGETAVKVMETSFDIVVTLVTEGPAAAWEKIQEHLTALKDQVIGGIIDLVVDTVVKKAIPKLVSMFIPGAGFISAIVSIYDTIMVIVDKLGRIAAMVKGFVDSIVAIAGGAIDAAAKRVEMTLASALSLAISVLAGFVGLGNIAEKVMGVITKIRAAVDKAIDALIAWIVKMAKALFASAKAGVAKLISWWKTRTEFKADGQSHALYFEGEAGNAKLVLASTPMPVEAFLSDKEKGATGDQQTAIGEVRRLLKAVKDLTPTAAAQEQKKDDETLQKQIEALMNQMGAHLVKLLSSTEWGTEANPAPFDYQKRRAEAYPTFYLASGKLITLTQPEMQARFATQKEPLAGDRVFRYRPTESTEVPDKSEKLGLGAASQVEVGRKLLFEDKEARGGGVPRFKDLVGRFGLKAVDYGWDIDHVVELQIGGKDEFANMWPLPKGENRSSGSIIKNASIEIVATKEKKQVQAALAEKKKGTGGKPAQQGLWLLIKSTRQL
ncbi:MAG TPA: DUF4157 domain-containing protein [Casimicrobiaceae bacterium]|nr:DUF4157 domain-containing protein [Casimicrobiaceae bacterium]